MGQIADKTHEDGRPSCHALVGTCVRSLARRMHMRSRADLRRWHRRDRQVNSVDSGLVQAESGRADESCNRSSGSAGNQGMLVLRAFHVSASRRERTRNDGESRHIVGGSEPFNVPRVRRHFSFRHQGDSVIAPPRKIGTGRHGASTSSFLQVASCYLVTTRRRCTRSPRNALRRSHRSRDR